MIGWQTLSQAWLVVCCPKDSRCTSPRFLLSYGCPHIILAFWILDTIYQKTVFFGTLLFTSTDGVAFALLIGMASCVQILVKLWFDGWNWVSYPSSTSFLLNIAAFQIMNYLGNWTTNLNWMFGWTTLSYWNGRFSPKTLAPRNEWHSL